MSDEPGTDDLVAALGDLLDRYSCESAAVTFRLADGVLMTVALDVDGNLVFDRSDGGPLRRFTIEGQRPGER